MPATYRQIVFGGKSVPIMGADYQRSGFYGRGGGAVEQCWNLWFDGAFRTRDGITQDSTYADGAIHNGGAAARARWVQTGTCLYAEELT